METIYWGGHDIPVEQIRKELGLDEEEPEKSDSSNKLISKRGIHDLRKTTP